jgi:hypothetical protein
VAYFDGGQQINVTFEPCHSNQNDGGMEKHMDRWDARTALDVDRSTFHFAGRKAIRAREVRGTSATG